MQKLLIVSATSFEITPLEDFLKSNFRQTGNYRYVHDQMEVSLLITGVGLPLTAYALGRMLGSENFDLVVNAGIAGAFNRKLNIGDVVQVVEDQFADIGVEEADGSFSSVHTMGLIELNQPPFIHGKLINESAKAFDFLPKATAISVNKVHGNEVSIKKIQELYTADLETMEGAAFFYVCLLESVSFLQLRSVSNYVESRNKENWDIPLAINNLNDVLKQLIQVMMVAGVSR
ncbi:MAG: futalosine hydrolase [Bacteroidetes bacterium]|nr:MAG: futalosine hydrolase [Bacteroidota bacterium]